MHIKIKAVNASASFKFFENVYTEAEVKYMAPMFSPMITQKGYLFSMLIKNNTDVYFKLEGQVLQINPTK
ncbi:MAG: hypothetical protein WCG01_01945 [bacterium]